MKKYLIGIVGENTAHYTTINGDSSRPFQIAGNLWSYVTPWTAAQRLEKLAQSWERHGHRVMRVYGSVHDMPTEGDAFNVGAILNEWRAEA